MDIDQRKAFIRQLAALTKDISNDCINNKEWKVLESNLGLANHNFFKRKDDVNKVAKESALSELSKFRSEEKYKIVAHMSWQVQYHATMIFCLRSHLRGKTHFGKSYKYPLPDNVTPLDYQASLINKWLNESEKIVQSLDRANARSGATASTPHSIIRTKEFIEAARHMMTTPRPAPVRKDISVEADEYIHVAV